MARLGAKVVGADASETNIEVAKLHAVESGLAIDYRATTAEAIAKSLEGMADVAKLPLPKVLKVKVAQEFKDVEWVRKHWDEAASYEEDTDVEDEEYLEEDVEVEGRAGQQGGEGTGMGHTVTQDVSTGC